MTLAKRIVAWREARGLSQTGLARALHISPSAVCQWEREHRPTDDGGNLRKAVEPSLQTVVQMTKVLRVSMAEFFGPVPRARKTKRAA